ncbi:MAG TPA: uracil-DNA glycosylase [Bacteroidota bacterium]|nr:uracil-DNA glycosylase [Bacteroidota bacterium]
MSGKQPSGANLLSDIRGFLERERDLLGETLLCDQDLRGELTLARAKSERQKPVEEPTLFEFPAPRALPVTGEPWGSASTVHELHDLICTCVKCPLGHTRTQFVFGTGNPAATLMIVGEAPGADEDAQGEPFVGRAGQLLNKILEAIGFKREEVYICNILKCRPPGNRKPLAEEVDLCIPYLRKQIALVKPRVILALGLTAAENLLGTTESLGRLRGRILEYEGTPLMVTYHPAALLRNPNWKRPTWEDVQAVRKLHDKLVVQGR